MTKILLTFSGILIFASIAISQDNANIVVDSIYAEESGRRIAEMQTRYETDRKEKEIAILSKERAIQDLEFSQTETRNRLQCAKSPR